MSQHITLLLSSITFLVGGLPIVDVSIFSDPDQNLGKFLDPDPNIMYRYLLDPQHLLYVRFYDCEQN